MMAMGRRTGRATARCAVVVAASLAVGGCGGEGSGWDEQAKVTGNACPPVKRVVKKAEVERALGAKVDQGRLSQFPLLLDVPTCRFDGRGKTGPVSASFAIVNGLADDVLEQFKEQHTTGTPAIVSDLGDEAVWFEQPRMLFVREGSRLFIVQLSLSGPQFQRYRERATKLAGEAVERL